MELLEARPEKMSDPSLQSPAPGRSEWVRGALERYESPLLLYATAITHDAERARDVVQEVFLRLCAQDPPALGDGLGSWLFTVCRNLAIDMVRKEARVKPLNDDSQLSGSEIDPAVGLIAEESRSQVQAALALLPPSQREVILLKFQSGLSYREISDVTGYSPSNVGYLLHVGLKTVRAHLTPQPAGSH